MSGIDWVFWKHKTEVELWQAVCLSCNIDPDSQKKMYQRYGKSYNGSRNEKVTKRLELLIDNLSLEQYFSPQIFKSSSPNFQTVILSEFATWCLHIGYGIPKELTVLAAKCTDAASGAPKSKCNSPSNTIQSIGVYPEKINKEDTRVDEQTKKPWLIPNPNDPEPEQPWYTPARYFARQLVMEDSNLLTKRNILCKKVSNSLKNVGINKRGGKKSFNPDTIKKALSNINLG